MFEHLSFGAIIIYACFVVSGFFFEAVYGLLLGVVAVVLFVSGFHGNPIPFVGLVAVGVINSALILWKTGQDPNKKLFEFGLDLSPGKAETEPVVPEKVKTVVRGKEKDDRKKQVIQGLLLVLLLGSAAVVYFNFYAEKSPCPPSKGELMQQQAILEKDDKKMAAAIELIRTEVPRSQRCPE